MAWPFRKKEQNGAEKLQQAVTFYDNKNHKKSIQLLTELISDNPTNPHYYLIRGTAYEEAGMDSSAEKDLYISYQYDPTSYVALFRLGLIYSRKKDYEKAIEFLLLAHRHALSLSEVGFAGPRNLFFVDKKVICNNLGNFYIQVGNFESAEKFLIEATKLDSNYSQPYIILAILSIERGKPQDAVVYAQKAVNLGNPQAGQILQLAKSRVPQSESQGIKLVAANPSHTLPDLVAVFQQELENAAFKVRYFKGTAFEEGSDLIDVAVYYALNMTIEYQRQAGNVPENIANNVWEQVNRAAKSVFPSFGNIFTQSHAEDEFHKKLKSPSVIEETTAYVDKYNF